MMHPLNQVDSLRITTLVDDYVGHQPRLYAEHGISFLVEISSGKKKKNILFDTGQSGTPLLHNMELLDVDPSSIDAVFLSHCHYDHTGGLVEVLTAIGKNNLPVIGHPAIFRDNYVFDPFIRNIGITEKNGIGALEDRGGQLILIKDPFEIMPGVLSSGEVPRRMDFEQQSVVNYNLVDGALVIDQREDDLSIIVNVKNVGLVVLVGCSHAGIINIINHAKDITGIDKVEAVMGGFPLIKAADEKIFKTARALSELDIATVIAGHCTGFKACAELDRVLKSRFQLMHCGKVLAVPEG